MRRALLVVAFVGLALGACGDDDDEPSVPTEPTLMTTTTILAAPTTASARTRQCESVGFTPNSEDAASDITATGLSCEEARAFVMVAGRQTSSGGPRQVEVQDYDCQRTRFEQEPLPRSFYECANGSRKVTFVRS